MQTVNLSRSAYFYQLLLNVLSRHLRLGAACFIIATTPALDAHGQSPGVPTEERAYAIVAAHSGKCLDVEGASTGDGAAVLQYGCARQPNQLWRFRKNSRGEMSIIAEHSGKCLSIARDEAGDPYAIQRTCQTDGGSPDQIWTLRSVGDLTVNLVSLNGTACIDVEGADTAAGARIVQFDCAGTPNQEWKLVPVPMP